MKHAGRDLLRGTAMAVPAAGLCWLLAHYAFGRLYYLPMLLAMATVAMLLTAWVLHLKADGFFRGVKQERPHEPPVDGPRPSFASFHDGILERSTPDGRTAPMLTSGEVARALLWGAAELCLASVLLYRWVDIGLPLTR